MKSECLLIDCLLIDCGICDLDFWVEQRFSAALKRYSDAAFSR
jgi:hypothetical protein